MFTFFIKLTRNKSSFSLHQEEFQIYEIQNSKYNMIYLLEEEKKVK